MLGSDVKKVLLTGGAGFIGSHVVEHFHQGADVRVLDDLRSGFKHNLAGLKHEFIQASILDRDAVRQAVAGVDHVFHLAAMISVPESVQKPALCHDINVTGTLVLLEEAARAGVKKLVLSSSAAIYGDNPAMPKVETMPPEPKSPYAATKLEGESLCQKFTDEGRLATASLRYFNVFGPRQDPKSQYAAAMPAFIAHALRNEPITIFGDGQQTRDFIFVKDIVAANIFIATGSVATGVFNVAYGRRVTINELVQKILRLTHSRSEVKYGPERPGDVKHSQASTDKLRAAGFVPSGDFDAGLADTIRFFSK